MLGRYAFILPDGLDRGELRPLRDPQNTVDVSPAAAGVSSSASSVSATSRTGA